jgi:hypothetical protein
VAEKARGECGPYEIRSGKEGLAGILGRGSKLPMSEFVLREAPRITDNLISNILPCLNRPCYRQVATGKYDYY